MNIRKVIYVFLAVVLMFAVSSLPAGAQGFKGILDKLDALEAQLKNLEKVEKQDVASLRAILANVKSASGNSEYSKIVPKLESKVNELSIAVKTLESQSDELSSKFENVKSEISNKEGSAFPAEMFLELRELITELKETVTALDEEKNSQADAVHEEHNAEGEAVELEVAGFEVNAGVAYLSRYVWRGIDFGDSPSFQPSLTFSNGGFEFGFLGAYTASSDASGNDENDIFMSYSVELANSWTVSALLTDYYFPNAGAAFSNTNNYDDPAGAGAHTFEAGLSLGAGSFSFSGFMNFYNDEGNNAYFEIGYATHVQHTELHFFFGVTPGSTENPGYYHAEKFEVINIGVAAVKEIKITESFSLPLSFHYGINPAHDISHLVVGVSF